MTSKRQYKIVDSSVKEWLVHCCAKSRRLKLHARHRNAILLDTIRLLNGPRLPPSLPFPWITRMTWQYSVGRFALLFPCDLGCRIKLLFNRRNCIGQRLNCDTMKFYFGSTSASYPTSELQLIPVVIKLCSFYLWKLEVEKSNQPYEGCFFSHWKGEVWTVWRS